MKRFEFRVWEKAEHWYFYSNVEAADEAAAWKAARKDYPRKEYSVSELREVHHA